MCANETISLQLNRKPELQKQVHIQPSHTQKLFIKHRLMLKMLTEGNSISTKRRPAYFGNKMFCKIAFFSNGFQITSHKTNTVTHMILTCYHILGLNIYSKYIL